MAMSREEKRAYDREWMRKRREDWFSANGPCVDCGSWERLEIDHVDRSTKVSHRIWSWSEKRRLEELAKCAVRCHTCHRKKTNPEMREWLKQPSLEDRQREMRERMIAEGNSRKYHTSITNQTSLL